MTDAQPSDGLRKSGMALLRVLMVVGGLAVIWQGIVLIFRPPHFMLPGIDRVVRALIERPELWQVHAVTTAMETLIGLAAGTLAGMALALLMSFIPFTRRLVLPTLIVSQAFPVFAIAPLLVLWFGYGIGSKIVMATIAIFFPVASAFHDGLARTDTGLLDLSRLYRARHWQEVALIRIPNALPSLISGLRLAAVYAPIGALIGEWVGASSGLGYAMLLANGRAQTDVVFACLLLIAAMSLVLRALVDLATRNVTPWAPETA